MLLIYHIVVSIVGAIAFDWAFHVQIQLIYGATHKGVSPTRYHLGPPLKIIFLFMCTIVINVIIINSVKEPEFYWIIFIILAVVYALYAAKSSIDAMRHMKNDKVSSA